MPSITDIHNLKKVINKEFTDLEEKTPEYKIQVEQTQKNIMTEIDRHVKIILLPDMIKSRFMHLIAGYVLSRDERKAWYLYHAVAEVMVIPEVIEAIKDTIGIEEYIEIRDRIISYATLIERIKSLEDHLEEKTIKTDDNKNQGFKELTENLTKLPLIYPEINEIFTIICTRTNLGSNSIPNQVLNAMERQLKKINYQTDKKTTTREEVIGEEQNG